MSDSFGNRFDYVPVLDSQDLTVETRIVLETDNSGETGIDAGGERLTSVSDPVESTDLATKAYVDAAVEGQPRAESALQLSGIQTTVARDIFTSITHGGGAFPVHVVHADRWLLVGTAEPIYSDDGGGSWSEIKIPGTAIGRFTCAYSPKLRTVIGYSSVSETVMTSSDGITFTEVTGVPVKNSESRTAYPVLWDDFSEQWIGAGGSDGVYISYDGITWTAASSVPTVPVNGLHGLAVTPDTGKLVLNTAAGAWFSDDFGDTWSVCTGFNGYATPFYNPYNSLFMASGYNIGAYHLIVSEDGETWTGVDWGVDYAEQSNVPAGIFVPSEGFLIPHKIGTSLVLYSTWHGEEPQRKTVDLTPTSDMSSYGGGIAWDYINNKLMLVSDNGIIPSPVSTELITTSGTAVGSVSLNSYGARTTVVELGPSPVATPATRTGAGTIFMDSSGNLKFIGSSGTETQIANGIPKTAVVYGFSMYRPGIEGDWTATSAAEARTIADGICTTFGTPPVDCSGQEIRAIISVSADDSIALMGSNYGITEVRQGSLSGTLLANSWSQFVNGPWVNAPSFPSEYMWTMSQADGSWYEAHSCSNGNSWGLATFATNPNAGEHVPRSHWLATSEWSRGTGLGDGYSWCSYTGVKVGVYCSCIIPV